MAADLATEGPHRETTWPLYTALFASAGIVIGLIWDISWHRTIGRDTFWSPPHLLEQLAAVIAGTTSGWLVLKTTFRGTDAERARSVSVWGFRGPLGAWVCIWGALAMVASAPFDDWWHNAYGLDVKIVSPPHAILAFGMIAIQLGAILMCLAYQNRATQAESKRLGVLYAISAGILLTIEATVLTELAAFPNHMHSTQFYRFTAIGLPLILVGSASASRLRWPATITAATYTIIALVMLWVLQFFPATAKLAPINNPVTHMVPPPFPLLLIVPAFAIDVIMHRLRDRGWRLAVTIGIAFVAIMLTVHWPWSEFLLSPSARNHVFGADKWDYYVRPGPWRYQYWDVEPTARLYALGFSVAFATAVVTSRIGLWIGSGLARVKR